MLEREVTAREAAELSGLGERTIRRMIEDGRIEARKIARNRYAIRISNVPAKRHGKLEILEERVRDLEARLAVCEGMLLSRPTEGLEPLDAILARHTAPRAVPPAYTHVRPQREAPARTERDPDAWPDSISGRAKWIEDHGGPKWNSVRAWREVRDWQSVDDAVAGLAARGYHVVL